MPLTHFLSSPPNKAQAVSPISLLVVMLLFPAENVVAVVAILALEMSKYMTSYYCRIFFNQKAVFSLGC